MGKRLLGMLVIGALCASKAWGIGVGEPVGALSGTDEQGRTQALSAHEGKTVVYVFWGSRCPSSQAYAKRIRQLAASSGAVFVGVASNAGETPDSVKATKAKQKLSFPIVIDSSKTFSKRLGAGVTPTVCVVDGRGVLQYRGAIDDDPGGNRAKPDRYLQRAIQAVKAGQTPSPASTRPRGVRIK